MFTNRPTISKVHNRPGRAAQRGWTELTQHHPGSSKRGKTLTAPVMWSTGRVCAVGGGVRQGISRIKISRGWDCCGGKTK